jgi:hypothetical protein
MEIKPGGCSVEFPYSGRYAAGGQFLRLADRGPAVEGFEADAMLVAVNFT